MPALGGVHDWLQQVEDSKQFDQRFKRNYPVLLKFAQGSKRYTRACCQSCLGQIERKALFTEVFSDGLLCFGR